MKITALGVWTHSHAGPTTSFYAEVDGAKILLDTGVDPIGRMRALGMSPAECTHLYLSHLHSDHSSGFSNFVFTRELLGRANAEGLPSLSVMGSPGVIEGCQGLLKVQYPDRSFNVNWIPVPIGSATEIASGITLRTIATIHSVECAACRLTGRNGDVGFTADTAPSDKHRQFLSGCDVLIGEAFGTEASVGAGVNKRGHSTAEDLGRLVAAATPRYVIPFHFGPECADDVERARLLRACAAPGSHAHDAVATPSLRLDK